MTLCRISETEGESDAKFKIERFFAKVVGTAEDVGAGAAKTVDTTEVTIAKVQKNSIVDQSSTRKSCCTAVNEREATLSGRYNV
jgi:hypothetical protein